MFIRRHKYLTTHVPTLLRTRALIFDVDASCSCLAEHLRQLHCCSQTSMASVSICNDWVQKICCWILCPPICCLSHSRLLLLSVVKVLRLKQLLNFVRHRIHWIVCHIGPWFVRSACCTAALPATYVNACQASFCHLDHLNCGQSPEGMGACSCSFVSSHHVVQLRRKLGMRISQRHRPLKCYHFLGCVRTLNVLESLGIHPFVHLCHAIGHTCVFGTRHRTRLEQASTYLLLDN
mmetsp:Transcript_24068/g.38243  ORF Transcript_24068/g.38243 Transcript_24068/m.38243 type:complete len:235 (-) Transcript_24068:85-789(-)